jgi:hypothetical protein
MSTAGAQRMSKEGRKKKKIYVMPEWGKKAIFILYSSSFQKREISLTWYMTWPIKPLSGLYRTIPSLYDFYGVTYAAEELQDYYVVLAIPVTPDNKDLGEQWKGKKVVVWGYQEEEVLIE